MISFLRFSIGYFIFCFCLSVFVRGGGLPVAESVVVYVGATGVILLRLAVVIVIVLTVGVIALVRRGWELGPTLLNVLIAFCATIFIHAGFVLFKTSMPEIIPFYADHWMAATDKWLHGGQDAWILSHNMAAVLPMPYIVPLYFKFWISSAIFLPTFLAMTDNDTQRVRRTLILFAASWVIMGNFLALAGMSVGPIFYDQIYGGDRFAAVPAALDAAGELTAGFRRIQEGLWWAYTTQSQSVGSGISAFPSVHVAIALVTALYAYERSRWFGILGAMYVAAILFLSVYSGFHYAIDGYFSIVVIWGMWMWLRRVQV